MFPSLEFTVHEIVLHMLKLSESLQITGLIVFGLSYFNSLPSKWEPIIEKTGYDFEFIKAQKPKISLILSTNKDYEEMNINISDTMVFFTSFQLRS